MPITISNWCRRIKYMQILFFLIVIIIIIIIGQSHLNKKLKKILLMILSFIYNTLLGLAMWFSMFIISFFTIYLNLFSLSMIIVGILFLIALIPINIYVKRKVDINIIVYIILNIIGFLIGLCLLWRG